MRDLEDEIPKEESTEGVRDDTRCPDFTAEEMSEWLREHDIDWPPDFLDFSPIELAWNAVEKQMADLNEAGKDNDR